VADPRLRTAQLPIYLLLLVVLVAAFLGGLVARMLPSGQTDTGPRILAGPADSSLAPLVRKTSPAVVNIAVLQPSPAEQNPLLQDPFFRRYFGVPDANRSVRRQSPF
jgi:hypothetical protein